MKRLILIPLTVLFLGCLSSPHQPSSGLHWIQCDTVANCIGAAADLCNYKAFSICSPSNFMSVPASPGKNRSIAVQCKSEQTGEACR